MKQRNFFAELKRRNVYKVAIAYIVAGWALSQGIAQVFPVFDVPNWVIRLIVLLIIIGLPIALVLSWMFEITPEGIIAEQLGVRNILEYLKQAIAKDPGYAPACAAPADSYGLLRWNEMAKSAEVPEYALAIAYTSLGKQERAMEALERGFAGGNKSYLFFLPADPFLDDLHGDPRFEALVQKITAANNEDR